MGKCRSCNNLENTGFFLFFFLMKLATWIDSKVENNYVFFLLCLPNIDFGCYGNFKLPLVYNGKMQILQQLQTYMFFFLMKLATWIDSKVENMYFFTLSAQYKLWLLRHLEVAISL